MTAACGDHVGRETYESGDEPADYCARSYRRELSSAEGGDIGPQDAHLLSTPEFLVAVSFYHGLDAEEQAVARQTQITTRDPCNPRPHDTGHFRGPAVGEHRHQVVAHGRRKRLHRTRGIASSSGCERNHGYGSSISEHRNTPDYSRQTEPRSTARRLKQRRRAGTTVLSLHADYTTDRRSDRSGSEPAAETERGCSDLNSARWSDRGSDPELQ